MAEPETYVVTRDIKAAVAGRETDVLDGLHIDWRRCTRSNHIHCPYPSHGSDGDNWRWDAGKARAFCTCNPGHADGILDVVMKCEGSDIDGAKVRAAEMIGRFDLIKTKGKGGQKTDPISLLNPSSSMQDKSLPRAYLAHRLGLDVNDVPMPVTKAIGWSELPYVDPPAKGGSKFVEVARPPCAVFETVAADGRRHAHRIYTAVDGAGKADLGKMPDGRARDPKNQRRRRRTAHPRPAAASFGATSRAHRISSSQRGSKPVAPSRMPSA